jgi:hypothetical protein
VKVVGIRAGKWLFVCTRTSKHAQPYKWTSSDLAPTEDDAEPGVMESLGLFDDLPHCLDKEEAFVEYGIVEYRYRTLRPEPFAQLLNAYGHHAIQVGRPYTTSSFLASALRILADRGELELRWGPATGFWSYNGTVSYWAVSPAGTDKMWSWSSFADAKGVNAEDLVVSESPMRRVSGE